jgi:hypothetical protein
MFGPGAMVLELSGIGAPSMIKASARIPLDKQTVLAVQLLSEYVVGALFSYPSFPQLVASVHDRSSTKAKRLATNWWLLQVVASMRLD